ncbi:hypothetical protein [Shinella sp.]|uniref:hypothetical protein n=1 Tax=Shinella sp. TaxID=1870904 RepID=UPI002590D5A6|nr:hypothetical protein [Shinella sp.]MCW5711572.1 hypothetical protein [Shinella sp.]
MASDYDLQILAELIDEVHRPTPIRKLPRVKRLRYQAVAAAKSRRKVAEALANGIVPMNHRHIREALCDAAMHILSSGQAGADTIRQVLATVFAHDSDAPAAIIEKIEAEKIRPTLFKPT